MYFGGLWDFIGLDFIPFLLSLPPKPRYFSDIRPVMHTRPRGGVLSPPKPFNKVIITLVPIGGLCLAIPLVDWDSSLLLE